MLKIFAHTPAFCSALLALNAFMNHAVANRLEPFAPATYSPMLQLLGVKDSLSQYVNTVDAPGIQ